VESKTAIFNLALGHLNQSVEVSDADAENSAAARVCRRYFNTARDELLREFKWPFATEFAEIPKVADDPTSEWAYSYQLPSDCLFARKILSGTRNDTESSEVKYRRVGRLIYTDHATLNDDGETVVELEYTKEMESVTAYDPDFAMALSFRLACYIAPSLTGGDVSKLGQRTKEFFFVSVNKAKATALNEEKHDRENYAEISREEM
jgi:hypothetical protein